MQIRNWLNWLEISGRSSATVSAYKWQAGQFISSCDKPLSSITTSDLLEYLAGRRRAGWGDSSVKLAANALRSLFAFMLGEASPARSIPLPRPRARPQRTLTAEQAMTVIASCDTSTPRGVRDLALLCLMLDTGLRAAEICRLSAGLVDVTDRWLQVRVKGGEVAAKVFTTYTAAQLGQWMSVREGIVRPGVTTLFVGVGGTRAGTPLTTHGLRCIFRAVARAAGLEKLSPHDMRRTFATLTIRYGASTRMVQQQGGWTSLDELERYTQALQLQEVERHLPVGRLMGL